MSVHVLAKLASIAKDRTTCGPDKYIYTNGGRAVFVKDGDAVRVERGEKEKKICVRTRVAAAAAERVPRADELLTRHAPSSRLYVAIDWPP